jgi:hypothetical protein
MLQFKKDTYIDEDSDEYTVEGEWLNGVPHGICIVQNEEARGIMTFIHGKVNGGPTWLEFKENGERKSYQNDYGMSYKGLFRNYTSDKDTGKIRSTANEQPTPGWLYYIVNIKDDQ